jgi:ribosomal protein S18 acetylase RimI-like enzyme
MEVQSRPYSGENDYAKVRELLIDSFAIAGHIHNWWIDRWEIFRFGGRVSEELDGSRRWEKDVRLWETLSTTDAPARLVGVVNPEDGDDFFIQIHPAFRYLEPEMVEWAEQHHQRSQTGGEKLHPLASYLHEHDIARAEILREHGFKNMGHAGYTRWRFLDGPLPEVQMPAGYAVRNVNADDHQDLVRRAAVANASFGHSRHNADTIRVLHRAPTYREDLDLVVEAPNGSFAAYCVIWFGAKNRLGWFEPVGTHPDHRRLGLAKGMMAEGLRRVKALGATKTFVGVGSGEAANRLYESVGFTSSSRDFHWQKAY